ncbi:MAG: sulfotransferase family protein [Ardenticatenaceae bacterium]
MKLPTIYSTLKSKISEATRSISLSFKTRQYEKDFAGIHTYCIFIGYPRSGHSLVGSLLDAHPNIIIAHELDALSYIKQGINQKQLFYLLLENSKRFTEQGRIWGEYSYLVSNQWNGRYQELRVIGDKKGGKTSKKLIKEPELFNQLIETVAVPVKMIHVMRNPFDTISTMSKKSFAGNLSRAINSYFQICGVVNSFKAKVDQQNWFDMRHEDLIQTPESTLRRLYNFLGEEPSADLLQDGASLIYKSPHKSRYDAPWTSSLINMVEEEIAKYVFLEEYRYDN